MYKQTNTICKPKHIRLFALIMNCTILMKTNSRFSQNVYTISDRIWCNKHLRHTTTEKYANSGKGGYFWFDDDNNMSYRYILSIYDDDESMLLASFFIKTDYFSPCINSLRPSDAIWRQRTGSTLAQVMACCLTAPSHYLNQCWLVISEVQWHSY